MKRDWGFLVGVFLTASWLAGGAWLLCLKRSTLADMPLNALGDFAAGVFAPVAFLWLVLGYMQQGREMKQNTEALKDQEKQLDLQVRETSLLAKAATEQAEMAKSERLERAHRRQQEIHDSLKKATPRFRKLRESTSTYQHTLHLQNIGGAARYFQLITGDGIITSTNITLPIKTGDVFDIAFNWQPGDPKKISFSINTYDELGDSITTPMHYDPSTRILTQDNPGLELVQ